MSARAWLLREGFSIGIVTTLSFTDREATGANLAAVRKGERYEGKTLTEIATAAGWKEEENRA